MYPQRGRSRYGKRWRWGESGCVVRRLSLAGALLDAFFFFNDTATTEIYTLSLHDALPISRKKPMGAFDLMGTYSDEASNRSKFIIDLFEDFGNDVGLGDIALVGLDVSFMNVMRQDRKSTRLNSSH